MHPFNCNYPQGELPMTSFRCSTLVPRGGFDCNTGTLNEPYW